MCFDRFIWLDDLKLLCHRFEAASSFSYVLHVETYAEVDRIGKYIYKI